MNLPYIKLFTDFSATVDLLSDAEAGRLLKAVLHYANNQEVNLTGQERLVYAMLKSQIDRDAASYQQFCDKQRENGLKGGRPKKPTETQQNPNNPTVITETQKTLNKDKDKEFIDDNEERAREGFSYQHTEIGTLVSTCLKAMTPRAWEELKAYMGEMPEELIAWAVQTSCEHGGNNWAYVSAVLRGLQCAGIKTVEDAEKRSEEHRRKRQQTGRPSGVVQVNYEQREYEERKEGELPAWLRDMMEEEKAG